MSQEHFKQTVFSKLRQHSSMSGQFNEVHKKIQDKLGRRILYMPCSTHHSNTLIEHSYQASAVAQELFNVIEELYEFFTGSTKCVSCLLEFIGSPDIDNLLQLQNNSKTRWAAWAKSIKAVWAPYEAILKSLANLHEHLKDGKT